MEKQNEPRTDIAHRFGRRIRNLRKARGVSQTEFARQLGIDRSFLSSLENGKKSPTLVIMEVIALGFQMSLADLFRPLDHPAAQTHPEKHPSDARAPRAYRRRSQAEQLSSPGYKLSESGIRYLLMHRQK